MSVEPSGDSDDAKWGRDGLSLPTPVQIADSSRQLFSLFEATKFCVFSFLDSNKQNKYFSFLKFSLIHHYLMHP